MKIISEGFNKERRYTMRCRKCGTTAVGEASEGRFVHDPRDGDALVFNCPKCNNEMWALAKPRIPSSW